jgi:hypothetical protein
MFPLQLDCLALLRRPGGDSLPAETLHQWATKRDSPRLGRDRNSKFNSFVRIGRRHISRVLFVMKNILQQGAELYFAPRSTSSHVAQYLL